MDTHTSPLGALTTTRPSFRIECTRPWLVAKFPTPHRMVSWSLNRPGFTTTDQVAWLEVQNEELISVEQPASWLQNKLDEQCLGRAVGLITARNVARHHFSSVTVDNVRADCLITLGLNNGETVGKRINPVHHPLNAGTINILVSISVALTDAALLEMASIVTQARTFALIQFGYRRQNIQEIVTGTGTDCIAVATPLHNDPQCYAGMHTNVGEAVGQAVINATLEASDVWLEDWKSLFSSGGNNSLS